MPKRRHDPRFEKAAKLQGVEKLLYLARGELDLDANWHATGIQRVEQWRSLKYSNPMPEILRAWETKADEWIHSAIVRNDGDTLRKLADVLDRFSEIDRIRKSSDGGWRVNAMDPLAAEIAFWEWQTPQGGTFNALWEHLNTVDRYRKQWRRLNANKLESAKRVVRDTARQIGTRFAKDTKGPRKAE